MIHRLDNSKSPLWTQVEGDAGPARREHQLVGKVRSRLAFSHASGSLARSDVLLSIIAAIGSA